MYVVTVEFEVHGERRAAFRQAVQLQAHNSLTREETCRRFDVWQPEDDPNRFFLYELYDDRAAFDRHLEASYFHDFGRTTAPWVRSKKVTAGLLLEAEAP